MVIEQFLTPPAAKGGTQLREDGGGDEAGPEGSSFAYSADGFTDGAIGQHRVPYLSCTQQIAFRDGCEPRPVDVHDLELFRALKRGAALP